MTKSQFSRLLRYAVALILLAAGLAMVAGFDRMGHRAEVLGWATWVRVLAGLWQVVAAVLLVTPGRTGYGAALGLVACSSAVLAHATTLGWDSAPPAVALGLLSALFLWRNRADLRR